MNRPSYDEVHRLVLKMREGSREARLLLIEAHLPLAVKVARREQDDEEVLSVLLVTLVEAVDEFRESSRHPAALPSFLKAALGRDATGHVRERRGGHHLPHNRHCATNDAHRFMRSGRSLPEYAEQRVVDLMDQVLSACEDDREREMVYYRSLGMTYAEVALRVGTAVQNVARAMQKLELRFTVKVRHA